MIRHHVLLGSLLAVALAAVGAAGWGRIAVWAAPEKAASAERTAASHVGWMHIRRLGEPPSRSTAATCRSAFACMARHQE